MDAKELRIGNLLQTLDNKQTAVTEIITTSNYIDTYFWCYNYNNTQVKPIELTEEWLIELGGIENQFVPGLYEFEKISVYIHDGLIWIDMLGGAKEIPFVHTFQNLTYALTGEELKTKQS